MDFDDFLQTAWTDHATDAAGVAARLDGPEAVAPANTAQLQAWMRLLTHVWGEHLGQWAAGEQRLLALARAPAWDGSAELRAAQARHLASLRWCAGQREALQGLDPEDQVAALAAAASALASQGDVTRAVASLEAAWAQADALALAKDSPAWRSLAVGSNNLAATLHDRPLRDAQADAGMVLAAQRALQAWRLAGTWLEEERAQHRLSTCLLRAGRADEALAAAQCCADVCEAQQAPAFEHFFAQAQIAVSARQAGQLALFQQARERALACLEQVPAADRHWCESERADLG